MAVSAIEPISLAIDRTARILFKPFNATKWFTLGFCAGLAHLAEGGAGNLQMPNFGGGGGAARPRRGPLGRVRHVRHGARRSPAVVPPKRLLDRPGPGDGTCDLGRDRLAPRPGKFIFLEGVARNQAAVVEPWKRVAPIANSYFRFQLLLAALALAGFIGLMFLAYAIALPDIRANQLGPAAITGIAVSVGLLVLGIVVFALVHAVSVDFLIPLMYLRGAPVGVAWREFRTVVVPGNLGAIVLFYVMRIVLGFGMAIAVATLMCVTCFIAALPYLGTVLLLPLIVFDRCYSLCFLRQIGNEYEMFEDPTPLPAFPVVFAAPPEPPPVPPPVPPPLPPSEGYPHV